MGNRSPADADPWPLRLPRRPDRSAGPDNGRRGPGRRDGLQLQRWRLRLRPANRFQEALAGQQRQRAGCPLQRTMARLVANFHYIQYNHARGGNVKLSAGWGKLLSLVTLLALLGFAPPLASTACAHPPFEGSP